MPLKCLIVHANELVGAALESLCKAQAGVEIQVVRVKCQHTVSLLKTIQRYRPAVLILEEDDQSDNIHLSLALLLKVPGLRIIGFSADSNTLHVYEKRDIPVNSVSDFFSLLFDQHTAV